MEVNVIAAAAVFTLVVLLVIMMLLMLRNSKLITATEGKAVLITGCDHGFGYMLAKRLDFAGYKVFAGCLDANGNGAAELKSETSGRLQIVQLDVTKDEQIEAARMTVAENLGDHVLWAIVNNAGLATSIEMELLPKDRFQYVIEVNLIGVINVTRAFLPLVRAAKGRVINLASLMGRTALPGSTAYATTKFGVVGFSDALRRELIRFGVKVILVEPFFYKTTMCSADYLIGQNDIYWENTQAAVKKDYGQAFYNKSQKARRNMLDRARTQLDEVVDCMEQAVSSVRPRPRYVPPWHIGILDDLLNITPYFFQDWLLLQGCRSRK